MPKPVTVPNTKGEWPSFRVKQDEPAAPPWGGEARVAFELSQDGRYLQVKNVGFVGEAGERYVPLSLDVIPMRAYLARITKDMRTNLDVITQQGNKRFEIGPDGLPLTLTFEPPISGEERVIVEYTSGVLGRVMREERTTFVKARRTGQDPPK
jgi:hypothetical protein